MPPLIVTLASSLLTLQADRQSLATERDGQAFRTGIKQLDRDLPGSLWRGGDVVGIGSGSDGYGPSSRGIGRKVGSLPLEIIVTHLLDQSATTSTSISTAPAAQTPDSGVIHPSVFIVAPPTQATSSIQKIYTALNTKLSNNNSRQHARHTNTSTSTSTSNPAQTQTQTTESLLSSVSLLQYLTIPGLISSLSEILSTIHSNSHANTQSHAQQSILLLSGLPPTLTTTTRLSGPLQTAALLSTVLQSLRNITRSTQGSCLVLVELDVAWVGGSGATRVGVGVGPVGSGLRTAFSSDSGKVLRVIAGVGGGGGGSGSGSGSGVLSGILEEGMDVLLVLHDGGGRVGRGTGQMVIECVRDERGDMDGSMDGIDDGDRDREEQKDGNALGAWTVWG